MHFKKNRRGKKIRKIFAGTAVIMALALMLSSVPVSTLYAEQTDGDLYMQESARTAEGVSDSEKDFASEGESVPEEEGTGEDSEGSVTSPNVEKPQEESEKSAGEKETVFEAETVSANVMRAAYDRQAVADKSGGLDFGWRSSLPKVETEYTAGGGRIIWTPKLEGSNVVSGTLTLQNARIDADGQGICVCVPTTVVLEGENQIVAGKTNQYAQGMALGQSLESGLTVLDGSVIRGSGSLEIQSPWSGLYSPKGITIDGVNISIVYGSSGISTSDADIVIKNNSQVKVTGSGANTGALRIQNLKDIIIENSKVIAINSTGAAMITSGNIRLISSDVRAVGHTDSSGASGTLSYQHLTVDGGLLYAGNTGPDEGIPSVSGRTEMINSAVLYTAKYDYVLPIQGGAVWYSKSSYDPNTDTITAGGNVEIIGNVTWNENMYVPEGKTVQAGRNYNAKLTIPEGTVMEIPKSSFLKIYSSNGNQGTLINDGTINIQDGGSLYNYYLGSTKTGGTVENNGTIQVSDSGILQNQNVLNNTGTIYSTGNFSNACLTGYPGSINNSGTIDGFVIEMRDNVNVNKANGNTVLKKGQMLTLGVVGSGKGRTLQVPEGATLTVEKDAIIDAKTNVTKDTLSQYLDIADTLVLKGVLLLPGDTPEDIVRELGRYIEGDGRIQLGDTAGLSDYYIVNVAESIAGNTGKGLYKEGDTVDIDAGSRDGYRFLGWTAVPESVRVADSQAVRTTFTMPAQSVTLTANWEQITYGVTVNGSKAAVTGAGVYAAGAVVTVDAGTWEGYVFKGWSSEDGAAFVDSSQAVTTFVMPGHPVTVVASWEEKPEETAPSEDRIPPEETAPSEDRIPPEETTPSQGGTGSSSGNKPSSSGSNGKQENAHQAAKPEETLPEAKSEVVQNQSVTVTAAGADTGDASHMEWYLLIGFLSLFGCVVMKCRLTKSTFD